MTIPEIYERAGIRRLPVDPVAAASAAGVKVISYKAATRFFNTDMCGLYSLYPCGFSFKANGVCCIALNENSCGELRRRFTAAHELAHCILGHLDGMPLSRENERNAEHFAAELLAPLAVLHELGARTPAEISRLCGISRSAAAIRAEQLARREHGGFTPTAEERRMLELFIKDKR